jgi:release factor glutamine methyltransferase
VKTPASDAPWTVARLLAWTQEYLHRRQIEPARLCAEILLAHALGCERLRLYTCHEQVPDPQVRERFRTLVQKAATGYPVAYLTGTKEFFSLSFEVTPDVLIPRPETEILVERTIRALRSVPRPAARILDLGTGSGCIAVSLARHLPDARIAASDCSPAALAVARRNAERHGVAERIEFRCGDLFEPWSTADSEPAIFDFIVCNPPYVAENGPVEPQVREYEPHVALFAGADGLDLIRRIVRDAARFLRPAAQLLLEIGFDQASAVRALLDPAVWTDVAFYRDGGGHPRVLHARRRTVEQTPVVEQPSGAPAARVAQP